MSGRKPSPLALALLIAAGVVAVQALLVPLFAGVAANSAPRDLPVVVAGPAPAADQFVTTLSAAQPGAFEIIREADEAAADRSLRERRAYGAFVVGQDGVSLRTASASSPVVAQLLTQFAAQAAGGAPVPVTDVVPGSPDDPRGAGFGAGFLPLVLTSMFAGVLLTVSVPSRRARLVGLIGYAILAGLAGTAILSGWLGVLGGAYLANAAVIGLVALAVAATVAGLGAALGGAGVMLGALLVFMVGNSLSAVTAAPELLPQPWGQLGQWLPPGAGGTLLRSVAWFDGAGAVQPLWALAGWVLLGLGLVVIGRARVAVVAPPR